MIVVPRVSQPSIGPTGAPDVRQTNQVSAEGMGANVGQSLQGLGQAVGEIQYREQLRANIATLNQARVDMANDEASLFDPSNPGGVHSFKGNQALQAPNMVKQNMDQFYQQYQAKLTNPMVRDEFGRMFAMHRLGVMDRANNYALQQNDQYQQQAFTGAVGSALAAASEKALAGDADGSMAAQMDGAAAIKQYGAANGWAPAYTQSKLDAFTQHVQQANQQGVVARTEQMIAQDPGSAAKLLAQRINIGQGTAPAQSGDPNAPIGIRNNNPTNLRASDTAWQGKGAPQNGYESFGTPLQGLRAGGINAVHLQDKGAASITDLITKWAPPTENDTQAYIADVSKQMGVAPTSNIDLHNPDTLASFLSAVTSHENGQNPYHAQDFKTAALAALGKGKLPDSQPPAALHASGTMAVPADGTSAPPTSDQQAGVGTDGMRQTGNYIVDSLKLGDAVQLYNRARAQAGRQNLDLRTSVAQRVRDDTAAFQNGQNVQQPLTQAEFTQAYGDQEGLTAFDAYHSAQQFGQDLQTVETLTPQQMHDLLQAREPQPGLNYAVKSQEQERLTRAMQQTIAARQKDPVQWAQQANVGNLQPLSFASPDKLAQSLAARVAPMHSAAQTYGMPYRLLSATDQSALSQALNAMPATQKAAALGAMTQQLDTGDFQQVLSAIKANSPVASRAGEIMAAGHAVQVGTTGSFWWKKPTDMSAEDVAQTMLAGDALINPTKDDKEANGKQAFMMPDNSPAGADSLLPTFTTLAGDAFRGDGQAQMQAYQAYRAMYAGLAAKAGKMDGTLDPNIAQEAAKATLGNVADWGGHNVIPPYGMDEAAFTDAVNTQWSKIRGDVPGAESADASAYTLSRLGSNSYALSSGGTPVRDNTGKPVVLRVNYPGAIRYIAPPPVSRAAAAAPPVKQPQPGATPAAPTMAGAE